MAGLKLFPRGWRPGRRRRAAAGEEVRQVSAPPAGRGGEARRSAPPLPIACCRFAGGGGGWTSRALSPQAGRSPREGAKGGEGCAEAWAALRWAAAGGFGGGGGACAAGGGGGGYRGRCTGLEGSPCDVSLRTWLELSRR